ncbi:MAG: hypothetical protein SPG61_00315 [Arcanobacterium sp.]|nr:hypothetical protein [Arcanobacterium sp.]
MLRKTKVGLASFFLLSISLFLGACDSDDELNGKMNKENDAVTEKTIIDKQNLATDSLKGEKVFSYVGASFLSEEEKDLVDARVKIQLDRVIHNSEKIEVGPNSAVLARVDIGANATGEELSLPLNKEQLADSELLVLLSCVDIAEILDGAAYSESAAENEGYAELQFGTETSAVQSVGTDCGVTGRYEIPELQRFGDEIQIKPFANNGNLLILANILQVRKGQF